MCGSAGCYSLCSELPIRRKASRSAHTDGGRGFACWCCPNRELHPSASRSQGRSDGGAEIRVSRPRELGELVFMTHSEDHDVGVSVFPGLKEVLNRRESTEGAIEECVGAVSA